MIENSPMRKVRKEKRITLTKMAKDLDSDVGNLSRIERGIQRPSNEMAEKIAACLGLTETHIFYPERFSDDDPAEQISVAS